MAERLQSEARLRLGILTLLLAATPLHTAEAQAPARAVPDSVRLQGEWRLVQGSVDGHWIPPSIQQGMRRRLLETHLVVAVGPQVYLDATVRLHPDTRPAGIDYLLTAPPGTQQLGIYRWAGDSVEFCFAKVTQPRPSRFEVCANEGLTWTRWVRAK